MTEPRTPKSATGAERARFGRTFRSARGLAWPLNPPATAPAKGDREAIFAARGRPGRLQPPSRRCATSRFDIHRNEITALIGPSGCGKSTLLRCLNRMNDLIPGARVEGEVTLPRPGHLRRRRRRRRGAQADRHGLPEAQPVPQDDLRQHRLRPARARDEGRAWTRWSSAPSPGALWDEVKDRLKTKPSACRAASSSGSASRAALAVEPDVILMDEPCSALDPISTAQDRGPDGRAARRTTRS